jgi:catechol 2,3-dioxygenase-like lactoylglutathione lyase family enzyme
MFDKIQHIGYLAADLDAAIAWLGKSFGAQRVGGGPVAAAPAIRLPAGGRNAFVRFGQVEVELIEPADRGSLARDTLLMHHVGYVVHDIRKAMAECRVRGFKFVADTPRTNTLGQQVLYFDSATTNNVLIHLTHLPTQPDLVGVGAGLKVDKIVHAGYLVADLEAAIAWYEKNFDGQNIGGGASRRGGRNAFVNFGQVQVELIEPQDRSSLAGKGHVMDHVGYVVADIGAAIADCQARGFRFVADAPIVNPIRQQVLYFDTATTLGTRMHLTQLPD